MSPESAAVLSTAIILIPVVFLLPVIIFAFRRAELATAKDVEGLRAAMRKDAAESFAKRNLEVDEGTEK